MVSAENEREIFAKSRGVSRYTTKQAHSHICFSWDYVLVRLVAKKHTFSPLVLK